MPGTGAELDHAARGWLIAGSRTDTPTVGFVLIGGRHQLLHILPVAAALSRRRDVQVRLFAATPALASAAAGLMTRLSGQVSTPTILRLPRAIEILSRADTGLTSLKLARLLCWSGELRRCDVLVTAERTSTALKRLPGRCPPMIHIPHGAGDRAVGFEPRIARFEQVIVAGNKDRDRMVAAGLVTAERCHVSGYLKVSAVRTLASAPPLFANGRPTVLYNPHFEHRLSSWQRFGRSVIDTVLSSDLNLVVAPHVRMFAGATESTLAKWQALEVPGRFLFDPGSERSMDMSYTQAADIYLGDVSSQVYEFAATPRPCVFLNAHAAQWQGNPDYMMWRMGAVVDSSAGILPALLESVSRHHEFLDAQQSLVKAALGDTDPYAPERAAQIIIEELNRASRQSRAPA
jgi:hypothetical protein